MLKRCPKQSFADDRGAITDLLVKEPIEYVTMITSKKGAERGHHYHEKTVQWVYILEGRMKMLSQNPGEDVQESILEKGDLALNDAKERHALVALEDTTFLVFTRGPRGADDYESDTFRLTEKLSAKK